jgi:hypothetical protein
MALALILSLTNAARGTGTSAVQKQLQQQSRQAAPTQDLPTAPLPGANTAAPPAASPTTPPPAPAGTKKP